MSDDDDGLHGLNPFMMFLFLFTPEGFPFLIAALVLGVVVWGIMKVAGCGH